MNEERDIIPERMKLEEYFSIEDYGILLSIQNCILTNTAFDFLFNSKINLNKNNEVTNTIIIVHFLIDGKEKEVLAEKKILNKVYAFCKIYSENNKFIKILVNRAEKYDTNDILQKINENKIFRGAIKIYLNIDEFPIKTYYLEEKEFINTGNDIEDIEKEFILKKIK